MILVFFTLLGKFLVDGMIAEAAMLTAEADVTAKEEEVAVAVAVAMIRYARCDFQATSVLKHWGDG